MKEQELRGSLYQVIEEREWRQAIEREEYKRKQEEADRLAELAKEEWEHTYKMSKKLEPLAVVLLHGWDATQERAICLSEVIPYDIDNALRGESGHVVSYEWTEQEWTEALAFELCFSLVQSGEREPLCRLKEAIGIAEEQVSMKRLEKKALQDKETYDKVQDDKEKEVAHFKLSVTIIISGLLLIVWLCTK